MVIAIYVDDLLVTGPLHQILAFKRIMQDEFQMVDSGDVGYFLGIQVKREGEDECYIWSQQSYIEKLLKEFNMHECTSQNSDGQQIPQQETTGRTKM